MMVARMGQYPHVEAEIPASFTVADVRERVERARSFFLPPLHVERDGILESRLREGACEVTYGDRDGRCFLAAYLYPMPKDVDIFIARWGDAMGLRLRITAWW